MKILLLPLWVVWTLPPSGAWIRGEYEDAFVVARSEHIVAGHLKEKSISYLPHGPDATRATSGEHRATLVITGVLKGDLKASEIPITIHYGLTPRTDSPQGAIEIWDTGSSGVSPDPIVKDARQDHLWFLRKLGGIYGREAGVGNWGVVDPEDISPLSLKDYYLAYKSENPEVRLKKLSAGDPILSKRAAAFLDPVNLRKILAEEQRWSRAMGLLLFLIRGYPHRNEGGFKADVRQAGEELIPLFEHPQMLGFRGDAMNVWASLRYEPGVDPLLRLLGRQAEFWETWKPEPGWLDSGVHVWEEQKRAYGELSQAISALRRIGDSRARDALEATRKRWQALGSVGAGIVEECASALDQLPKKR